MTTNDLDLSRQVLLDYRLTTAEIFYRFPDHPALLQAYIWQDLDLTPDFPVLHKFLNFWDRCLEGKLHSVNIVACEFVRPTDFRFAAREIRIH